MGIGLGRRHVAQHHQLGVVRRPVERVPEPGLLQHRPALARGQLVDVDIGVLAVAHRGRISEKLTGVGPARRRVARPALGQAALPAGPEVLVVDLVMLVAAEILAEQEAGALRVGLRRNVVDRLGKEGELAPVAARVPHLVDLPRLAEARGDENALRRRQPAGESRGTCLLVLEQRVRDLVRDGRDVLQHQRAELHARDGLAGLDRRDRRDGLDRLVALIELIEVVGPRARGRQGEQQRRQQHQQAREKSLSKRRHARFDRHHRQEFQDA